jgi:hypothetical protein
MWNKPAGISVRMGSATVRHRALPSHSTLYVRRLKFAELSHPRHSSRASRLQVHPVTLQRDSFAENNNLGLTPQTRQRGRSPDAGAKAK